MILTDYYKFERVAKIAKHRMDCTSSTGSYPEFENRRMTKSRRGTERSDAINIGDLLIYWVKPDNHIRADRKRNADRSITIKSENLSSVYNWQREGDYWLAYGDFKGTTDALIILYKVAEADTIIRPGAEIEIFVARGKANECNCLCTLYADGELDEEMNALREQAAKTAAGTEKP